MQGVGDGAFHFPCVSQDAGPHPAVRQNGGRSRTAADRAGDSFLDDQLIGISDRYKAPAGQDGDPPRGAKHPAGRSQD